MVLKVSINLPGDARITLEASEPQVFREVVGLALRELPKDLMQFFAQGATSDIEERSKHAAPGSSNPQGSSSDTEGSGHGRNELTYYPQGPEAPNASGQSGHRTEAEEAFARFCGSLSPLGDMRRVVVAAEGARRFLEMDVVSKREVGRLFDLVGWRQSGDFLQTIRNASRSKFRWLERVPGSPGYYAVTEIGREKVIAPREK